jgi:hypothetical protein
MSLFNIPIPPQCAAYKCHKNSNWTSKQATIPITYSPKTLSNAFLQLFAVWAIALSRMKCWYIRHFTTGARHKQSYITFGNGCFLTEAVSSQKLLFLHRGCFVTKTALFFTEVVSSQKLLFSSQRLFRHKNWCFFTEAVSSQKLLFLHRGCFVTKIDVSSQRLFRHKNWSFLHRGCFVTKIDVSSQRLFCHKNCCFFTETVSSQKLMFLHKNCCFFTEAVSSQKCYFVTKIFFFAKKENAVVSQKLFRYKKIFTQIISSQKLLSSQKMFRNKLLLLHKDCFVTTTDPVIILLPLPLPDLKYCNVTSRTPSVFCGPVRYSSTNITP